MQTLLKRIQVAIGAGAALCLPTAACSDSVSVTDAGNLETYPLEQLGCSGPVYDGGYYGQCCVEALCYSPTPATGACMAADDLMLPSTLTGFPPGSGSCGCSALGAEVVAGPYASNPNNPDEPDGTCCYLVGSIACTGRPLCIEGEHVVAAVVSRKDWI